jgi:NAD+ kinase
VVGEDAAVNEQTLRQVGLVAHPTRDVAQVLEEISSWSLKQGVAVGQVPTEGQSRRLAEPVDASDCDLLLALGGDGTTLLALHTGAAVSRPVMGVACGSVGALTVVKAADADWALEQVAEGRWTPVLIPALEISWAGGRGIAINDLVVIRDGPGQLLVSIHLDDVLYARLAGDGLVVGTALGSSAYTMAAGGPLLAPGAEGITVTPLAPHGGSIAPLVAGPTSRLTLDIEPGYGGVRYELDGRRAAVEGHELVIGRRPDYANLIRLADDEPRLSGLRRRGLILDGPRVLVRENRPQSDAEHRPV